MTNKLLYTTLMIGLLSATSCSDKEQASCSIKTDNIYAQDLVTVKQEPHQYGGWHCPDNLNGFPAINISQWQNVPVVNGRMPTLEEARNGTSLIFVDMEKYPDAHVIESITLPKLAKTYNRYSKREELIIVIQAFKINDDSIVGYRYLNGGNGSARLNEVTFLTDDEIAQIPASKFVTNSLKINASQDKIWNVLTKHEYVSVLQPIFDKDQTLEYDWSTKKNVNFNYPNAGLQTAAYGDLLFGNYYIQNDYNNGMYTEKFFLLYDHDTKTTELKIVAGPFIDDYEHQEEILLKWANEVKALSEY